MLKKSTIIPICRYCNGWRKTSNYLRDLYACIAMDVKNQQLLMKPTSGYCISEMALWKLYIKNVGITQCSFWSLKTLNKLMLLIHMGLFKFWFLHLKY